MLRYISVCNPEGKRWQAYSRELNHFWRDRGFIPEVEVIPWAGVAPRDGKVNGLAALNPPALVRLESPGRDFEVMKLLLQAGVREAADGDSTDWSRLTYQKGRLIRPGLLHRGFCRVLGGLRRSFDERPHLRPSACPLAIAELLAVSRDLSRPRMPERTMRRQPFGSVASWICARMNCARSIAPCCSSQSA